MINSWKLFARLIKLRKSCSQAQRLFSSNSRYLRKFDKKGSGFIRFI